MSLLRLQLAVVCVVLAVTTTSMAEERPVADTSPEVKTKMKKQKLGDMQPVHALGDIYLAGQPTPDDLALLKRHGIETIISLRFANEVPWDEAAAIKQHGMKFVHVPFQTPEQLKRETFDQVLKILRDKKRGPVVLHCGSANRVGAIWYAHRVLDGKLSPEEALAEAKQVGLRTPGYLDKAREYVEQAKKTDDLRSTSPGD